ncbi:MAG: sigma 54-interacting transcriptional regulator [Planctomycetes bacterium]|nr:sigma 54-interacting transcriptional regulator [Planctomycetota bacterium]
MTVGRAPENDVSIADPRASRVHLRIEPRPGGYRVVDAGSQNGTFRNGRRVRSAPVRPGDVVVVGSTRIIFESDEVPAQVPRKTGPEAKRAASPDPDTVTGVGTDGLGKRLQRVAEVTRALSSEPGSESLLDDIIDAAVELTGSERGFLILSRKEGMEFAAARNIGREDQATPEFEVSWSIAIQVGTRGEAVLAVNAAEDERFSKLESVESLGLRSVLCVPVTAPNRVMGVIYVDNRLHLGAYDPDDQSVLEILADQAGIALANRLLMSDLVNQKTEVEDLNQRLEAEVERQGDELGRMREAIGDGGDGGEGYRAMIGGSARMDELRHLLQKVAVTDFSVLVHGESGTGKELVARYIHANSGRARGPFVSINCAAIPETLLESELFGHVRGAFTGADSKKRGLFEVAHRGTLLLDEVSEMSAAMQSRLLRVLQENEVRPVGGKDPIQVDVRVVAASNRDLASMIRSGEFREDLYYRLRVLPVVVPPLRERRDDVPDLISHFFQACMAERGVPTVTPDAMDVLCSYAWPGNVRELENEIKRLSVLAGPVVDRSSISKHILEAGDMLVGKDSDFENLSRLVESVETREIRKALGKSQGNKTRAAELLGITRFTLQRKLDKYDIQAE